MTDANPGYTPLFPEWPKVRCDRCRTIYETDPEPPGGFIKGNCPKCGHDRFSTVMRSKP